MTLETLVFQEQLEKKVLRATQVIQETQGRLDWQGYRVQWDQLDLLVHRGHQDRPMAMMDMRGTTASPVSEDHLDLRAHRVSQVYQVNQVYQAVMEIKEQKDHGAQLGFQVWTGFLDNRAKKETEETKEKWVFQGGRVAHLDPPGLLDLQDGSPTNQQEMEQLVSQVEQVSRDQWEQREKKEIEVQRGMHPRGRKENLESSWDLMADPCTWGAWLENRGTWGFLVLRGLQVLMVHRGLKERSGSQVDQVVQASTEPKERKETRAVEVDIVTLVLQVLQAPLDLLDHLLLLTDSEDMTTIPDITLELLKERKVNQESQVYQATAQTLTFKLTGVTSKVNLGLLALKERKVNQVGGIMIPAMEEMDMELQECPDHRALKETPSLGHKDLLDHQVHQEEAMMVSLDHQDLLALQAHSCQELPEVHRLLVYLDHRDHLGHLVYLDTLQG